MLGSIYSDQRCPVCGGKFKHDGKSKLFCQKHPDQLATQFSVRFKGVHRRFSNYDEAQRFLIGLRFKADQGSFDPRDWKRDNPLGFATLADKWLTIKEREVKPKSYNNLKNYMNRAKEYWEQTNIKEIQYGEIEDFFIEQTDISDKTKANMRSCLHSFWMWLKKRRVLPNAQIPDFPVITFELGWRKSIDKGTQEKILHEIYQMTYQQNIKIWIGVKWLCTYISLRPLDLINLKEGDIDLKREYLIIPHPSKSNRPKLVPLIAEDIEILGSMPRGLPKLHFFRHGEGIKGVKAGAPFGEKYFYKCWKKACDNLGIEGVDLYGGTRHSSACALRQCRTPEEIRRATMHETNKAFERYYRIEGAELRDIYQDTRPVRPGKKMVKKNMGVRKR